MNYRSEDHRYWRTLFAACVVLLNASVATAQPPATQPAAARQAHAASRSEDVASGGDDLTHLCLEDLMNVEVTSVSKKKQSIADAPAAVTVIDQNDIKRSGYNTIPDLLRLVPGMDVARINSFTWAVSARGLNDEFANKLLVVQDGRTLYTPINAGVYWDTVDYVLQDLDRIEVIRGPGATLWGANAVNGVVNITSKDSQDTQGWLISTRGSNDDSNLVARYGGKLSDDTYYRIYTKAKYNEGFPDYSADATGIARDDDWYSMRSGFRIDKHPSDDDILTLQGDLGNNQLHTSDILPMAAPPFTIGRSFNGSDTTGNVLARWSHRVDDDSDFSLQLYYDYLAIEQGYEASDQHTVDFDFHDRFMIGKRNEISWGLGVRADRANAPPSASAYFSPSARTDGLYSAFVQDTIAVQPERWFLTLGSKIEHNDFSGFELEPSARLLWTPNKQNSLWAAVSRASRSPSKVDTDLNSDAGRFLVPNGAGGTTPAEAVLTGDPTFSSEEMTAYELGYRVQATKAINVDIATFYNDYARIESAEIGPPQPGSTVIFPITWGNGIRGDTYGGEISANAQVTDNWRLEGSYSLLEAAFEVARGFTDATTGKAISGSSPEHQAQLHSAWEITRHLELNAGAYYTGAVSEYNVPAFISTDLNLVWSPKDDMEITLGVLNLVDNKHPEYGVRPGLGVADQVPRTLYAQFSYKF